MDKRVLLIFAFLALLGLVQCGYIYNLPPPKEDESNIQGLKCMPGRTVIRIEQPPNKTDSSDEEYEDTMSRRTHMNTGVKDETCQICVCSVEGKDEYCSKRPAKNINECVRLALIRENEAKGLPYAHDRTLAYRIRRDYIWHRDEIPYEAKSKCLRGTSYYSNSLTANDTDIDVPSEIDSLLDYDNIDICFFCVCSVDAKAASCINRDPWFCEYYRIIKEPNAARDRYAKLFNQDRPGYFQQLSYRLRRTMDDSMFSLLEKVGDKSDENKCVPFVSQYSDCSDENLCGGCTRCSCTAEGKWSCREVFECDDGDGEVDKSNTITDAVNVLFSEVKERQRMKKEQGKLKKFAPPPPKSEFDSLIVPDEFPYEETFEKYMDRNERYKRSIDATVKNLENVTVKFHNTVDEINEDTLRNTNKSGTIEASKVTGKLLGSRRKNVPLDQAKLSSLHIEYNQPQDYEHHIAENKIDSPPHGNDKSILSDKAQIHKILGNFSQATKDKDLSKIVVNELKKGKEIIGDKDAIPMSNITFTPENDTLTAMAFIAGNLLNKLWNMAKDSSESLESDSLKHQKINDLLELFKEPLNARQELFLKNALEKLSQSLNEKKNLRNITICETLETGDFGNKFDSDTNANQKCNKSRPGKSNEPNNTESKTINHSNVAEKLTEVLTLIRKFENTQKTLNSLREKVDSASKQSSDENLSDINNKFNLFGKVLEKVTKLLLPHKHSNRVINKIKKLHQFKDELQLKGYRQGFSTLSISAKDKIILDYLNHIKNNPNCLLSKIIAESESLDENLGEIKGSVFESISKLLSGKSLVDIEKLTVSQKTTKVTSTTIQPAITKVFQQPRKSKEQEPIRLTTAKERLKAHLQSIISDLVELQYERGSNAKKINISDILPCISHLIDKSKESVETSQMNDGEHSPIDNIEKLIDALKLEFSYNSFTRRSDVGQRPTSARVWERIITNMAVKRQNSRRFQSDKIKSYIDLKKMIDNIEKQSGTYKNYALLSVIPAYKKRMLLKTLQADISKHINVLAEIDNSFNSIKKISPENFKDVTEFIDNTAMNIKLSNSVLRNLNRVNNSTITPIKLSKLKSETNLYRNDAVQFEEKPNNNIKFTREQIMNQLMLNRIQLYLKIKEEEGATENDLNYNIGKRALVLLQTGNSRLAKELYQILVESKLVRNIPQTRRMARRKVMNNQKTKDAILNAMKEPLLNIGSKRLQGNADDIIFTK